MSTVENFNLKKKFGFGCMRLPMNGEKVDTAAFTEMVDLFMQKGFCYFDTARVYLGGQSETAIRECVAKRYPRNRFLLTNKLTTNLFEKNEDIRPLFEKQLASCGVDYFDFYLMHAQSKSIFEKFKRCCAYEEALKLKAEGKIKHFGISFHDTADVLDEILTQYPQIEVVQIQLNYLDYNDPAVQAGACYRVCEKHQKPVIVMEPVKGGNLVNLPPKAKNILKELHGGSPASYAIRYAAGFKNVVMVLSGMSNLAQMQDNLSYMQSFCPLTQAEQQALDEVCKVFAQMQLIPCTACRYCTDGCPKHISIHDLFSCLNAKQIYKVWNTDYYYSEVHTKNKGKPPIALAAENVSAPARSIYQLESCCRMLQRSLKKHDAVPQTAQRHRKH